MTSNSDENSQHFACINSLSSLTIFVDKDDGNWSEIPYEDTEKNLKWSLEIIAHMKNLISVVTTCEKIGHNHSIDVYDKEIRNFLDINFKN